MFNIVLFEPEIPPNTGNIIRLCANTGCQLHLVEPLGFDFDDKRMRRAGLDYQEFAQVNLYKNWDIFSSQNSKARLVTLSTHHQNIYSEFKFKSADYLVFGPETRGLPLEIRQQAEPDAQITLPMCPNSRSLNLSNSVAVVIYEAWRQNGFSGFIPESA